MLGKAKAKYIQSLGQKKHRDEEGSFIAEGPKIVEELLQTVPANIVEIFAVKEWINHNPVSNKTIEVVEVTVPELERISQLRTPNLVLAVVKKFAEPDAILVKGKIVLVLDTIQDPGNLGTIIRIADWFAIEQIICSEDCADVYNPKVVQATMGSLARVRVFYTQLSSWLSNQHQSAIYGAMLEGGDVTTMNKIKEGLIVIGNESKGVSEQVSAFINEKIRIPGKGKAESLNAAVATGIILSHLL
jgi:TrmH family RNA methyltransferase